jgi:hypothetical protein
MESARQSYCRGDDLLGSIACSGCDCLNAATDPAEGGTDCQGEGYPRLPHPVYCQQGGQPSVLPARWATGCLPLLSCKEILHRKKSFRYYLPKPGCHLPKSPGEGKIAKLFLQCNAKVSIIADKLSRVQSFRDKIARYQLNSFS